MCAHFLFCWSIMATPPIDTVQNHQFSKSAGPDDDLLHRFLVPALVYLIPDSFLFRREFDVGGFFRTIAINEICKIIRVDGIR